MLSVKAIDRDAVRVYYREYVTPDDPAIWLGSAVRRLALNPGDTADVDLVSALLAGGRRAAEAMERALVRHETLNKIPTKPKVIGRKLKCCPTQKTLCMS